MTAHRLYFAQHGLALDKSEDPQRPLSEHGIAQTNLIAEQLRNSQMTLTNIFHSGKLRAAQTAAIFAEQLNSSNVSAVDYLSPNGDVQQTIQHLDVNAALYIGHLPHLDKLISHLVTGDEDLSLIKLRNSAVLCLQSSHEHYQIQWYLAPDLLTNSFAN